MIFSDMGGKRIAAGAAGGRARRWPRGRAAGYPPPPMATRAEPVNELDLPAELGLAAENSGAYAGAWLACSGGLLESLNPATGRVLARVREAGPAEYDAVVAAAEEAFQRWRSVPAPKRGE